MGLWNRTSSFYRDTEAVILVYDITDETSFNNLDKWIAEIDANIPFAEKLIVGNKCDLSESRKITAQAGKDWSEQKGFLFTETSAKSSANVTEAFNILLDSLLQKGALSSSGKKKGVSLKRLDTRKRLTLPCLLI